MIKNTYLLFVSLFLVGSVFAEWALVDDFEDPATFESWSVTSDNTDQPGADPGRIEYVDDPVASGQGKVLVITTPTGSTDGSHSSMTYPLGELAIKDDLANLDKKQTVYFKLLRPLVDGVPGELDTTIGLMSSAEWAVTSGVTPPVNEEPDTIPNYHTYSTIVRYERDGIFDVWDGTPRYHDCCDTTQETNVWYEVWMVHSHGLNTYQVYFKGGSDFPEQTLITKEAFIDELTTHFKGNTAHYRVNTFRDLDWFLIRPNGGSSTIARGKDNTYIDDFYIDNDGENLSSPAVASQNDPLIGGAPIDGLQDWFFSDWFGAYNTTGAPWLFHAEHGFVYRFPGSSNLNMYVYDDAMGTWWWTSFDNYPNIYVFDPLPDNAGTDAGPGWMWYFEGSKNPRTFGALTGNQAGQFLYFNP